MMQLIQIRVYYRTVLSWYLERGAPDTAQCYPFRISFVSVHYCSAFLQKRKTREYRYIRALTAAVPRL